MQIVTADVIRELDRKTINETGIPGAVLMENAGRGATRVLLKHAHGLDRGPVVLVCGAGNNGGDGFVIARLLSEQNIQTKVFLLVPPERIRGDARIYFDVMNRLNIDCTSLVDTGVTKKILRDWQQASCIVDAIFGTGLSRDVDGIYRKAIEGIRKAQRQVLAVDIPSGVHADTGQILGTAVQANWTATFGLPKRGLYLFPGADFAGTIECVDIGIPKSLVDSMQLQEEIVAQASCPKILRRSPDTHKGTYGHLLVVAGSTGKTGAALLSSEAALRCGAGLVTLGTARTLNPVLEQKLTEMMTLPLPSSQEGVLSREALDPLLEFAESVNGLAVGPGLGLTQDVEILLRELWMQIQEPMVWDADALTILSRNTDLRGKQKASVVVTPHPGEMGRLLNKSPSWVQENRVESVKSFSKRWGVVTVLKGARTLIADPEGRLRINLTGNPGMASGGMGDVLTGMIGALMVQGMDPYDAATFGVWLHGAAGDLLCREFGPIGFLASDVMHSLPRLIKQLEDQEGCKR